MKNKINLLLIIIIGLIVFLGCDARKESLNPALKTNSAVVVNKNENSVANISNQLIKEKVAPSPTPKEVSQFMVELEKLQKQGADMQSLREKTDLESIKECGNLMRKYQPIAQNLRTKSEILPKPYQFFLGAAAIELTSCITCGGGAKQSCERVNTNIIDMNKRLAEQ